jgi:hypothetical protein
VTSYRIFVTVPRAEVTDEVQPMRMVLSEQASGASVTHDTVFRGPAS